MPRVVSSAVSGALVGLGALAVIDNVIVHWLLGWHRLNEMWSHERNLMGEVVLVVLGIAMVALGLRRERHRA